MTIGIPITQQGDGVQDVGGVHFKKWLLQKEPIASLPSNLDRSTGIISKKTPYAEHADRLPFSGSLTWSYDLSQDKLSKWKKLKNKSEPYFVPNTWFTELDKLLDKDLENAKKKIAKRN